MGELRRYIKSNNLIMRLTSLVLAVTLLASAFVYLGNEKVKNVEAEEPVNNRTYMEYIVQRLTNGIQDKFRVLEIVPYEGCGEFNDYKTIFTDNVVTEYKYLISERMEVNTVVAKKLTADDIKNADFIVINTGKYKGGSNGTTFYTKDGVAIAENQLANLNIYNTFEQVPADSIQSDDEQGIETGTIYFYNADNWSKVYAFWTAESGNVSSSERREMTKLSDTLYSIEVPVDARDISFTSGGAEIDTKRFAGFNKVLYGGEWYDHPYIPNAKTYDVTLPTDANITTEGDANAVEGKPYNVTLSAADGYVLPQTITVKIGDAEYTGFTYDNVTGKVTIPGEAITADLTGAIVIEATALKVEDVTFYTVTFPAADSKITCVGDTSIIANRAYKVVLSAADGFLLPDSITVTIGDVSQTIDATTGNVSTAGITYNKTTGEVVIPAEAVTGNIKINATGVDSAGRVAYVTRDMSWDTCKYLLDYIIDGRNLKMPDGTTKTNVKTPVIFNSENMEMLSTDSNIYKMLFIYRSCDAKAWGYLRDNLSTRDASGKKYKTDAGVATVALSKEVTGLDADAISWVVGDNNPITKLISKLDANSAERKGYDASRLTLKADGKIQNDDDLTNNYWVYSKESKGWYTSASYKLDTKPNETVFKNKTGKNSDNTTAVDVLKYLLGVKSNQITYVDMHLRVLEIQPSNSFDYDEINKIKELGSAFLIKGASSWTTSGSTDYKKYITIDHMTTNALNSIKADIVSNYDVVIIGENTDILTKGTSGEYNGKPIYNDRNLNGYVYLAFGDLFKISSNMLGYLPDEYIELTDEQSKSDDELLEDEQGSPIRNISDKTIWRGYLASALTAKKTKSGYFIVYDMYKYYVTKVAYRKNNNKSLASRDGTIDNESFFMDYYIGNSRLPDNDITIITKNKLIDFVKSGKPIIVSNSLYNADRTVIYPSSDMYDFAKNTMGKLNGSNREYKNVIKMSDISRAVGYLGTTAPKIEFSTGNVDVWIRTGTNTFTKTTKSGQKVKPVEVTNESYDSEGIIKIFNTNELKFKFTVTGQKNTKYRINFYVDKNSDGVYTKDTSSEEKNELFHSNVVEMDSTGERLYEITTELADDYMGLIGWKIEIVQLDANNEEQPKYKVEEKGFSVIYTPGDGKEIKVLQISPGYRVPKENIYNVVVKDSAGNTSTKTLKPDIYNSWGQKTQNGDVINIVTGEVIKKDERDKKYYIQDGLNIIRENTTLGDENMLLTDSNFTSLLNKVQASVGYTTIISVLTVEEFESQYVDTEEKENKYIKDVAGKGYGSERDKLSDYDMVVVGFADSFNAKDIHNDNGAVDNMLDYAEDGKALLFTHDTLSWRSTPNYVAGYVDDAGENFEYTGGYKSLVFTDENANRKQFSGYYMANTSPTLTFMLRNVVGMDRYGVTLNPQDRTGKDIPTYEAVDSNDRDYRPSYQTTDEVRELQGFNNWILWRNPFVFRHMNHQNGKGKNYYTLRPLSSGEYLYYNKDQTKTIENPDNWISDKAVCLNEGAVTMYPYNIGTSLTINTTHAQYFELDLEDEEIVVWYALNQSSTTTDNINGRSKLYGATYGDGANNYYIYSKGNITYSGAGHAKLSNNQAQEFKLFVNTIIKAIAGGNSKPVIKVVNGSPVAGEYIVYVNSSQNAGQYEIQFQATDTDLISASAANYNADLIGGLKVTDIYWIKSDGTEVKIKSSGYQVRNKNGEVVGTSDKLKNGMLQELTLGDTTLDANSLAIIERDVEIDKIGARFRIHVEDGLGSKDEVIIQLRVRDLFNMN